MRNRTHAALVAAMAGWLIPVLPAEAAEIQAGRLTLDIPDGWSRSGSLDGPGGLAFVENAASPGEGMVIVLRHPGSAVPAGAVIATLPVTVAGLEGSRADWRSSGGRGILLTLPGVAADGGSLEMLFGAPAPAWATAKARIAETLASASLAETAATETVAVQAAPAGLPVGAVPLGETGLALVAPDGWRERGARIAGLETTILRAPVNTGLFAVTTTQLPALDGDAARELFERFVAGYSASVLASASVEEVDVAALGGRESRIATLVGKLDDGTQVKARIWLAEGPAEGLLVSAVAGSADAAALDQVGNAGSPLVPIDAPAVETGNEAGAPPPALTGTGVLGPWSGTPGEGG